MDKLKNMLSSNKTQDTPAADPTSGDLTNKNLVAGEGSHFGSSRTADNTDPLSSSANPTGTGTGIGTGLGSTTTAGPHSSNLENKIDPRVDSDLDGRSGLSGGRQTGGVGGIGGSGSAVESDRSFPLRGGGAGVGSGVGSGTGSSGGYTAPGQVGTYPAGGAPVGSSTTAGPHTSNLENKLDPRVDSDRDGRSGLGNTGVPAAGTGRGIGSNTTAGPHSSNLENKMDPRVDSDRDGRSGLGNTGVGATGTGFGSGTGPYATSSNTGQLGSGAGTGIGAGTGTGIGAGTGSGIGAGAGSGIGAGTGAGVGHGSGLGHHGHSHEYKGDPCGPEEAAPGAPHFTSGPHATDTANRLDPNVSGGIGGHSSHTGTGLGSHTGTERGLGSSNTATGPGLGSSGVGASADPLGSSGTGTGHHHPGRDAALVGGAGAAGVGAYEAGRDPKQSSSTGPAPNTAGPHKSDALNKLDPRVDSDLSKQQTGTTSSSDPYGSSSTGSGQHHTGRDAALAGGAGVAGVGAYEAGKHHHQDQNPTGTSDPSVLGSSTTAGAPHHSHHQGHHDRQQQAQEHHHGRDAALAGGAGAVGVGAYEAEKHHNQQDPSSLGSTTTTGAPHHSHDHGHHDRQQHAQESHLGRDAGLAGAGTAAGYEAERHHGHPTQSSTVPSSTAGLTSSSRDPAISGQDPASGTGHHYGRDAGLVGAGGVGAYEAEKHLGHQNTGNQGLAAQGTGPSGLTGNTGIGGTQSGVTDTDKKDHHLGRDAGLAAGAGGVAYEAEKHHDNKDKEPHHDSGKKSGGIMGLFHRDKGDKEAKKEEKAEEKAERKADKEAKKEEKAEENAERKADHHTGRDAALGAGAAGTAYEAEKHHRHTHGPGDEEMAAGTGATGLRSDPLLQQSGLQQQSGTHDPSAAGIGYSAGHGLTAAGTQDSAISSGSGVAGIAGQGPTTHDAYGENDPNRINRLHKDPPGGGRGL